MGTPIEALEGRTLFSHGFVSEGVQESIDKAQQDIAAARERLKLGAAASRATLREIRAAGAALLAADRESVRAAGDPAALFEARAKLAADRQQVAADLAAARAEARAERAEARAALSNGQFGLRLNLRLARIQSHSGLPGTGSGSINYGYSGSVDTASYGSVNTGAVYTETIYTGAAYTTAFAV